MVVNRGSGHVLQGGSCACWHAGHAGQTSTDDSVGGVDWLAMTPGERGTLMEYAMARIRGLAEPPPIALDPDVPFTPHPNWTALTPEARERLINLMIAELRRAGLGRERPAPGAEVAPRWMTAPRFAEPVSAWATDADDGPDLVERPRGDAGIEERRRMRELDHKIVVAETKAKGAPVADRARWAAKLEALHRDRDLLRQDQREEKYRRDYGRDGLGGASPLGE